MKIMLEFARRIAAGRRSVILFLPVIMLLIVFAPLFSEEESSAARSAPQAALPGFDSISSSDMKLIIETLASDEFEGREADARGGRLASMFISAWLSAAGVPQWKGSEISNGFLQPVPCLSADVDTANSFISLKKKTAGSEKIFPLEGEVFHSPQSPENFSVTAPVVFAGYGIDAPEYDYSDYGASDVRGKIVIAFNHEPQEKDEKSIFRGTKTTRYSMPQVKAQTAQERGAVALLIIRDRNNLHRSMAETLAMRGSKEERGHFLGIEGDLPSIPIFYLEDSAADEIFRASAIDPGKTQAEIDKSLKSEPVSLDDVTLALNVVMKDKKRIVLNNIISKLDGSDSKLKDEAVIVSAHYDHLGSRPEGIYHGADDNASGVASLLMLARAFNSNPVKPKRSIYFVFFTAEEKGVIGSKYFASNLPLQKEKISAVINLDELGRNNMDKESNADMAIAFTSGQSPELREIVKKSNGPVGLDMKYYPTLRFLTNSDHALFHNMMIPVIFFFSGFHDDYHKTTDTADKINLSKLDKLTRLAYGTILDIANRESRIRFDPGITAEPEKDEFEKPY